MDRIAVFVDAGYLYAAGSVLITGSKRARGEMQLDYNLVSASLEQLAVKIANVPLLRVYWYDGTSSGPTPQQLAIAYLPQMKLRLGFVNREGQQKGVDSLIVTDMINLARNRAMSDCLLLSGDEDLRVGVQQAQEFGVRVHLLGIEPARLNQSQFLVQEADSTHEWRRAEISTFLKHQSAFAEPPPTVTPNQRIEVAAKDLPAAFDAIATTVAARLNATEAAAIAVLTQPFNIPHEVDGALLRQSRQELGRELTGQEKRQLRDRFVIACKARGQI